MAPKLVSRHSFHILVIITFFAGIAFRSSATEPALSPMPPGKSEATCHDWAADQDSDTIYAWGQQDNGQSSESVALRRLASYCQGAPAPDVVRYGSSISFDEKYCRHHRQAAICRQ
jgi:hypothetical protein